MQGASTTEESLQAITIQLNMVVRVLEQIAASLKQLVPENSATPRI